jgi:hypothetical protein
MNNGQAASTAAQQRAVQLAYSGAPPILPTNPKVEDIRNILTENNYLLQEWQTLQNHKPHPPCVAVLQKLEHYRRSMVAIQERLTKNLTYLAKLADNQQRAQASVPTHGPTSVLSPPQQHLQQHQQSWQQQPQHQQQQMAMTQMDQPLQTMPQQVVQPIPFVQQPPAHQPQQAHGVMPQKVMLPAQQPLTNSSQIKQQQSSSHCGLQAIPQWSQQQVAQSPQPPMQQMRPSLQQAASPATALPSQPSTAVAHPKPQIKIPIVLSKETTPLPPTPTTHGAGASFDRPESP